LSNFELITLYSDHVSLFLTGITVVTTILFSFVVGMYLMAGRLNLVLLVCLTALFAAVTFGLIGGIYAAGSRAASLGIEIVSRIQADSSEISWMYSGVIPRDLPRNFYYFFLVAIVLAVVFVFLRRREVRKRKIKLPASS
jgi:hypothetical protein